MLRWFLISWMKPPASSASSAYPFGLVAGSTPAGIRVLSPARSCRSTWRPGIAMAPAEAAVPHRTWGAGRPCCSRSRRLARQLDAVLVVDGDHLDLQLVADLADVFDLADVLVVQLADVAQAVAARQDLDEGAEVLDRRDPALVDLADLAPPRSGPRPWPWPPRRRRRPCARCTPCRRRRCRSWRRSLPGCP